jgi:hypothetical protein
MHARSHSPSQSRPGERFATPARSRASEGVQDDGSVDLGSGSGNTLSSRNPLRSSALAILLILTLPIYLFLLNIVSHLIFLARSLPCIPILATVSFIAARTTVAFCSVLPHHPIYYLACVLLLDLITQFNDRYRIPHIYPFHAIQACRSGGAAYLIFRPCFESEVY